MSLNTDGDLAYQKALVAGGRCFQTDPAAGNGCKREITRQNVGWAYLGRQGRIPGHFEVIECTACTAISAGRERLATFMSRHTL
jgi:hypothetical protein